MKRGNCRNTRKSIFHKIPVISLGGGGEGFSIPIFKDIYTDRPPTPPPREADAPKSYPQLKLNGVENLKENYCAKPEKLPCKNGKFSTPAGISPISPKPHPLFPQFPRHPLDVVDSMRRLMKARGLVGTSALARKYPLEIILEAINAVDGMISEGIEVRNRAGLILWRLERACIDLYRKPQRSEVREDGMSARYRLTPAETALLRLIAKGLNTGEICEELKVSEYTISHRLSSILSKLDARNRAHAVAIALGTGILTQEDIDGESEG